MKPFKLGDREFKATQRFLENRLVSNWRWEDRNIQIAYKILVEHADRMEIAKEYGSTKQNIHRIVSNFANAFLNNIAELGLYDLSKALENNIDNSKFEATLNEAIKNIHILAASRGVSLKEQIEFVDNDSSIDRTSLIKIIEMIFSNDLNNSRVNEWELAEPSPKGWINVNVKLPKDKAKEVAQMERDVITNHKGEKND